MTTIIPTSISTVFSFYFKSGFLYNGHFIKVYYIYIYYFEQIPEHYVYLFSLFRIKVQFHEQIISYKAKTLFLIITIYI